MELGVSCFDFITRNGIKIDKDNLNESKTYSDTDNYDIRGFVDDLDCTWLPLVDLETDIVLVSTYFYLSIRNNYVYVQDDLGNFLNTGVQVTEKTREVDLVYAINNFYYEFLFLREYLTREYLGKKQKYSGYPIVVGELEDEDYSLKMQFANKVCKELYTEVELGIPLCLSEKNGVSKVQVKEFCNKLYRGYCRVKRKSTLKYTKDMLLFEEFKPDIKTCI